MTFKKLLYPVLCLVIISMVACSTTSQIEKEYLNKKAPPYAQSLTGTDFHLWKSKTKMLQYYFEINDAKDTLLLTDGILNFDVENLEKSGRMAYRPDKYIFQYLSLYFLYIDDNEIVVSIEKVDITPPNKTFADVIPIKVSVPYKSEFKKVIVFIDYLAKGR